VSVYVTREIWKFSRAEHGALLTLLAIGDSGHKDYGTSILKQSSIAKMTRLGETAVRDGVRWLEDAGEIETRQAVRRRTRINVYRVLLGEFADVIVDGDDLGVRLLEPFSTPEEIAARRLGTASDDRRIPPVVTAATTAGIRGDDRRNPRSHKEEPVLDPVTREANASLVPADAGERESRKVEISLALSAALGVQLAGMTRHERGGWEKAIAELADVGATRDEVTARCAAYRDRWPDVALTPIALARHWSTLGVVVATAKPSGFDAWVTSAPSMFGREMAHEIVDDTSRLDDAERARRHRLVDERFDAWDRRAA
jgi:hypothetical protein